MFNLKGLFIVACCGLFFVVGCAEVAKPPVATTPPPADGYVQKARQFEEAGQWEMALLYWELSGQLQPENKEIAAQLNKARSSSQKRAEKQFQKGRELFDAGDFGKAQIAFVRALNYYPEHAGALEYLKKKQVEKTFINRPVKAGETLQEIARDVYKDPEKGFIVAYFNDIKGDTLPPPGTVLRLPNLSEELTEPVEDLEAQLAAARAHLKKRKYDQAMAICAEILDYDPTNEEATELANEAQYQKANEFLVRGKPLPARAVLEKMDGDYKDVNKKLAKLNKQLAGQAEEHYRRGIKYFLNEKLEGAILEWNKTLALNPNHKKAKRDIENARRLLEKLEKVK